MKRSPILGHFLASETAQGTAKRPVYSRALLEPLEMRQLLSVTTLAWSVDSANSQVTLSLPDQTLVVPIGSDMDNAQVRLRNQNTSGSGGTWTDKNTANFGGTLAIDYVDGSSIQFMTNDPTNFPNPQSLYSSVGEIDAGAYWPNPAAFVPDSPGANTGSYSNNSTAPSAFAARVNATITYPLVIIANLLTVPTVATFEVAYLSLSQLANDIKSGVLGIDGTGNFNPNTTNLSITSGQVDSQGLNIVITTVPSFHTIASGFLSGTDTATTASVATTGALTRKVTIPLNFPVSFTENSLSSTALTGTISGQLVATVTLQAPIVDLNGNAPGVTFTNFWFGSDPVDATGNAASAPNNAKIFADTANLSLLKVSMATFHTGDVLSATTVGSITQSYTPGSPGTPGTLTLSGTDTVADYETVLESVKYNNTNGNPGTFAVLVRFTSVTDSLGLVGPEVDATIKEGFEHDPPVADLSVPGGSPDNSVTWAGPGPVFISDPAATVNSVTGGLAAIFIQLDNPHTGDVLAATTTGSISQSFVNNTLTLSGTDSIANYQSVLRSVTYDNTAGGPTVSVETASVFLLDDAFEFGFAAVATINMPPTIILTVGAGSGTPNYTTSWYNNGGTGNDGAVPIENMAQATLNSPSGAATISSLAVKMATFHTGDVLAVPILPGVSGSLTTTYANGTLILSGTDTVGHYQQELRFVNYNNTIGGPGTSPVLVTFSANDGTLNSSPVTTTLNIKVASSQVLGNRLFYNNSKYDNNSTAIAASDDLAIASDKIGFDGTGLSNFSAVSGFNRGITGVMIDLATGIGDHANITAGDLSFKVSPITFVTTTFNQLSTWSAAPSIANFSVRMGAGVGGSDRLEITWANLKVTNTWLEVDVKANPATTGLTADDVFYFASVIGNAGVGDTTALSKDDANDFSAMDNNIIGVTTPVWNVMDYTKDGKVDANDGTVNTNNVFTLHYIANPTGPFAPDAGPSASPAAAPTSAPAASASSSLAVATGLSLTSSLPTALPPWLSGRLRNILDSQGVAKSLQNLKHLDITQNQTTIDQVAEKLHANDDVLDGLLAELGLERSNA